MDGIVKVLVEGKLCVIIMDFIDNDDFFEVCVEELIEVFGDDVELEVLVWLVGDEFECYVKIKKNIFEEVFLVVGEICELVKFVDFVVGYLGVEVE